MCLLLAVLRKLMQRRLLAALLMVILLLQLWKKKIRLADIDAPEDGYPRYPEVKSFLASLVLGKTFIFRHR